MDAEVVPVLHVADAAAAIAWYERLGFTEQWVHRFEFGRPDGDPPYGCELELRDLDGNRLRISRPAS